MSYVCGVDRESPSVDSVHVVREFTDVFPTDLHGLPRERDIDFAIELEPGIQSISIPSYPTLFVNGWHTSDWEI